MSKAPWTILLAALLLAPVTGVARAQSTDQQIQEMEEKLDKDATPDLSALSFQDDLTSLEECQSSCRPLIDRMIAKYAKDHHLSGSGALGADGVTQLAAALATAAATLDKSEAAAVGDEVSRVLGPEAAGAFSSAYEDTVAPYNPQ